MTVCTAWQSVSILATEYSSWECFSWQSILFVSTQKLTICWIICCYRHWLLHVILIVVLLTKTFNISIVLNSIKNVTVDCVCSRLINDGDIITMCRLMQLLCHIDEFWFDRPIVVGTRFQSQWLCAIRNLVYALVYSWINETFRLATKFNEWEKKCCATCDIKGHWIVLVWKNYFMWIDNSIENYNSSRGHVEAAMNGWFICRI